MSYAIAQWFVLPPFSANICLLRRVLSYIIIIYIYLNEN